MKILLIHPNPLEKYHLERLVSESLVSLGHEVSSLRYRDVESSWLRVQLETLSKQADLALILKGELLQSEDYDSIFCRTALWYVDHPKQNIIPDWLQLGCSRVDSVFTTSKGLIPALQRFNPRVHWVVEGAHLPLLPARTKTEEEKDQDIAFFGTLLAETNNGDVFGDRVSFLKNLAEKYHLHVYGSDSTRNIDGYRFSTPHAPAWNEDLVEEIASTRIVVGYNSTNSIPFYWSNRTYVTLACKGFLITPYVPGLESVFENHKELVWFHSLEECRELIDYYLQHPEQRAKIAEQGYNKVRNCFSTEAQVKKLLELLDPELHRRPKLRIAFITDSGYVGCLAATENWIRLLRLEGFSVQHFIAEEEFAPEAVQSKYDWLVFSGMSGKYAKCLEVPVKKALIWQSSVLQTQLENETGHIKKIRKLQAEGHLDTVICGDNSSLKLFERALWVPNFIINQPSKSQRQFKVADKINLCALSPTKARKNLYTILSAFAHLNDSHVLHINVAKDFFQKHIEGVFNTERIINHEWLPQEDYAALISQCVAGFQLSVAESYNYVVAEHWSLGTPIICSAAMPANPIAELTVSNHENSGEVLEKLDIAKRASTEQRRKWQQRFFEANEIRKEKARQQLVYQWLGVIPATARDTRRPRLSIVYHGRNDNYGGDFKKRLAWSLASVRSAFEKFDPEVLFVNWNTLPGTPPIFEEPLFGDYAKGIKVYYVPSAIHDSLCEKLSYNGVYLEWFAKNFGVRRALGEYVLQINSDNLILDKIPSDLALNRYTTYLGNRTEVSKNVLAFNPLSLTAKILEPLKGKVWMADVDRPHYVGGSSGEFVLTHRDNWAKICGNPETAARYCIDNVTATHLREISILKQFPYPIYHISHPSADGTWPGFKYQLGYSGPNWGLADCNVEPVIV